ncbi:MAG: hypothetical protein A2168_02320 [Planctomycetes bacterium RBG_13_50_24]|nr:MAG: hypothetical protein A2168_02320 [Planctomycetes bacterium RBG_13_50_24]
MSLNSNGIDSVRAFDLPAGIWPNGQYVNEPRVALVKWRSIWSDKFHQVYVNGRYAGTTLDSGQRQLIIQVPTSPESPVRIEVFAVEAEYADTDFSSELAGPLVDNGRVTITLLRSQNLPMGTSADIYYDNGTGQIDYDKPMTDTPIRIWPAWQDKAGLGMSRFGLGDFGWDSAATVGLGKGSFGYGQFGLDADTIEWTSPPLPSGTYKFAVKVMDASGRQSNSSEAGPITVTPSARPAEGLSISSFDKQTNQLVLNIENYS